LTTELSLGVRSSAMSTISPVLRILGALVAREERLLTGFLDQANRSLSFRERLGRGCAVDAIAVAPLQIIAAHTVPGVGCHVA
jgi:hypothetical protein